MKSMPCVLTSCLSYRTCWKCVYPCLRFDSKHLSVSGLPARPEAASGIRCIQASTRRSRDRNGTPRVHDPANQGRLVLRKRGGVWRVADFAINQSAKVPTRSQTWKWCYVWDCREENQVSDAFFLGLQRARPNLVIGNYPKAIFRMTTRRNSPVRR